MRFVYLREMFGQRSADRQMPRRIIEQTGG